MKKAINRPKKTFFEENKDLIVVGGVIVLLAGGAITYMYLKKKKESKTADVAAADPSSPQIIPIHTTIPTSSGGSSSGASSSSTPRITYNKRGYPLKYKTRHPDVKVLQTYLKIYKENLGRSGSKRDGVDGVYGPLTLKAANKRLGKSEFSEKDIIGMRKAIKMMGK